MEAKSRADANEAALSSRQLSDLAVSQGKDAERIFSDCLNEPSPEKLPSFVDVMELDTNGKVVRTWRKGDAEIAKRAQDVFGRAVRLFQPPSAPFFTSFSFSFKRQCYRSTSPRFSRLWTSAIGFARDVRSAAQLMSAKGRRLAAAPRPAVCGFVCRNVPLSVFVTSARLRL